MTTFVRNKQAGFNYTVKDTFEAGLSLTGNEVKSIKNGHGSLSEAFVVEEENQLYLIKAYLPPYQPGNANDAHNPYRKRKLLLRKTEIARLVKAKQVEGLTLIPIRLYNKGRLIKLEVALARGKKKSDKREAIKKRDVDRDLGRKLKNRG